MVTTVRRVLSLIAAVCIAGTSAAAATASPGLRGGLVDSGARTRGQTPVSLSPLLSDDLQTLALNIAEPGRLADFIASSLTTIGTAINVSITAPPSNTFTCRTRKSPP